MTASPTVVVRPMFGEPIPWPDGWPPPRIGEVVTVGEGDDAEVRRVLRVEWDPTCATVYVRIEGHP